MNIDKKKMLQEIVNKSKLNQKDIINIYLFGSIVYNTNNYLFVFSFSILMITKP